MKPVWLSYRNGLVHGAGFLSLFAIFFGIAWAGDIVRIDKDGAVRFWIADTGAASISAQDNANPALTVTQAGSGPVAVFSGGKVGIGAASPQGALDVTSTTGGLVVPRMTTAQRDALSPPSGTIIYNTTSNQFNVYDNGVWLTGRPTESYVNLVVESTGSSTIRVTADDLFVEGMRLGSVNVAADIAATGAGGRDGGSETANTWYYVWVITHDGTQRAGLLSTSSTSPNMPSGYTRKRRVGAVRNNATSDFLPFVQEGNRCVYLAGARSAGNAVYTNKTETSWTTASASTYIPPTSQRGIFRISLQIIDPSGGWFSHLLRKSGTSGTSGQAAVTVSATANVSAYNEMTADVDTDNLQQIQYTNSAAASTVGASAQVVGYYDRI